jgi:hypothetical protein
MKDAFEEGKKLFPNFVREIKKYPPGFHVLHPGASEKLVQFAEKKLKCKFPDIYRQFLKLWNGAILFGNLTMIYGIHRDKKYLDEEEFPVDDLVESNKKRWPGIPDSYLHIASTGYGDHISLDLDTISDGDVKVVQWAHAEGGTENSWKKFSLWLDYEMRMGKGAYDYKGNVL